MNKAAAADKKPRPSSAEATTLALSIAQDILLQHGLPALSIEAVAARTGLGKPTLYRRWPNAQALAMDALLAMAPVLPEAIGDSCEAALLTQMRGLVAAFGTPWGGHVVRLIATAAPGPAIKAFNDQLLLKPRAATKRVIEAGIIAGEIGPPPDMETLLDMIYGALALRLLLGHRDLYAGFANALVKTALRACQRIG